MIIFGFRSFVKNLAMVTLICGRCQNPAAHRVVQRSRWFTLFFIPLIPLSFTRHTVCAYCGAVHKVSKQDAVQMIAASQSPAPAQFGVAHGQQAAGEQPQLPQN